MYSFISACMNGSVNNREAGDLRRRRAHFDVIVMIVWIDPYPLIFVDIWLNKNKQIWIQTFEEYAHLISAVHNKCIHISMFYPVWYYRKLLWSGHFTHLLTIDKSHVCFVCFVLKIWSTIFVLTVRCAIRRAFKWKEFEIPHKISYPYIEWCNI